MEEGDKRWRNVLTTAALVLEGEMNEAKGSASGTLRGFCLELRLATRGSGSSKTKWTEVDAQMTLPAELVVFIHPQSWLDSFLVRRGLAVDVVLDDAQFDETFLVEAAPADVIRQMIDDHTRRRLVSVSPISVESCDVGLRLSKEGWNSGTAEVRKLLEVAGLLATRLRAACEELDRADPSRTGVYRGEPNAARHMERSAEKARVLRVRARRSSIIAALATAAIVALLVLLVGPWSCN